MITMACISRFKFVSYGRNQQRQKKRKKSKDGLSKIEKKIEKKTVETRIRNDNQSKLIDMVVPRKTSRKKDQHEKTKMDFRNSKKNRKQSKLREIVANTLTSRQKIGKKRKSDIRNSNQNRTAVKIKRDSRYSRYHIF